jgi:hypothetical protein
LQPVTALCYNRAGHERLWIVALDSMKFVNGYNASPGGDVRSKESIRSAAEKIRGNQWNVGYEHTEKACRNMSASQQCHTVSQATRDKISATRKAKIASGEIKMPAGGLTHWIGKTQSAESNRKRSVTLAGKYVGERASMFGRKHTEEWKDQQSARAKSVGQRPPSFAGKHHSPETIAKMRTIKLALHAAKVGTVNG